MFSVTPIVIALFIAAIVNSWASYVSWQKKKAQGGRYFALGMMGLTLWTLAAGLDYAATSLSLKIFFSTIETWFYFTALTFLTLFSISFAGYDHLIEKKWVRAIFVFIPVSNIFLVTTNGLHGWVWKGYTIVSDNIVIFEHGTGFIWVVISGYLLMVTMFLNVWQASRKGSELSRRQARLLLFAILFPLVTNLLYHLSFGGVKGVDWSSVTFSVTGVLCLWALRGTYLLDIVPIARDKLISSLGDGMIVLDAQNRIVDINQPAMSVLRTKFNTSIGKNLAQITPNLNMLLEQNVEREFKTEFESAHHYYDVLISPLREEREHVIGRLVIFRDITERVLTEKALRASEEKFYTAFRSSPDSVTITRASDGAIIEVNEGFTHMTGYTREDALGGMTKAASIWSSEKEREKFINHVREKGRAHNVEVELRTKSGRLFKGLASAETIKIEGEDYLLSVVRDVSELRLLEEELHRRDSILATLHQVTLDLVNRRDISNLLQTLLAQISSLLDAPDVSIDFLEDEETIVTYAASSDQPLKAGDRVKRGEGGYLSWQAVDTGQPAILADYSTWEKRRALYENFRVHAAMIVPIKHNAQVIGALNFLRREADKPFTEMDIYTAEQIAQIVALVMDNAQVYTQLQKELGERKQAELALRESDERYQAFISQSFEAIYRTEFDQPIDTSLPVETQIDLIYERAYMAECNQALADMYGMPAVESLIGLRLIEAHGGNNNPVNRAAFRKFIEGGYKSTNDETMELDGNGKQVWFLSNTVGIVKNRQLIRMWGTSINITERMQKDRALQEAQSKIVENQRAMAAFAERERLARELHDSIGQTFGYIGLQSDAIRELLSQDDRENSMPLLTRLSEVAREAHRDIRTYIQGLKNSAPVIHQEFFAALDKYCKHYEQAYLFRTQLNLPKSLPDVLASPQVETHLTYIIREALSNARRYSGESGASLTIQIENEMVEAVIEDHGIGFNIEYSGPERRKGSFFGLRIMRERAEEVGGTVTVESAPGKGTRVIVRLPRKLSTDGKFTARILIVDDHPLFIDGLRNMLAARGVPVIGAAKDGTEAQSMARTLYPDLILMDINMPRMNGLEATRLIKAEMPDIKVVMLTTSAEEEDVFEALRVGASGYLLKGMSADEFMSTLTEIIRGEAQFSAEMAHQMLGMFAARVTDTAPPGTVLTERQTEILRLVAQGLMYKEIGEQLFLTERTVKYHMGEILSRLHLKGRQEAIQYAKKQGLT